MIFSQIDGKQIMHETINSVSNQAAENTINIFSNIIKDFFSTRNMITITWLSMIAFIVLFLYILIYYFIDKGNKSKKKIKAMSECPMCGNQISIEKGKYNYYWHCYRCNYNQAIKHHCPECNQIMKIRKEKENFYIYCDKCNLEGLYYQEKNT